MPASTPAKPRAVRVFVSSTFRDMQIERDHLVKVVFPQLRKLCESRAVAWSEVDLRWGITDEAASEGQVLPLCLAEIERCRPYFIGLLGERYGWIPKDIPSDLTRTQPWLAEHLKCSVTELEIIHGVLRDPTMAGRALFYFRDPAYAQRENPRDFVEADPILSAKLADLKNRIRQAAASGRLKYQPRENYANPEVLGEQILDDFRTIIDELYPADEVLDPLDQEAMLHEAYGRNRSLAFVGREALLGELDAYAVSEEERPLVLTGDSGCGKSALLAVWADKWREQHPDDLLIQHFIGSTPESADWQSVVRRVLGELKRAFDLPDDIPVRADVLRSALSTWLAKVTGRRRIVLVLDALNQLTDDGIAHQLGWLPSVSPPGVRVIASTLEHTTLVVARRQQWPTMNVPLFDRSDIIPAAKAYFALFAKTPDADMLDTLQGAPAATNALYLRAVLDELRQFGKHSEVHRYLAQYLEAADLPSLFERILRRWDVDFGDADLVRRSLCMIAASRFGLSEPELLDLLGDGEAQLPRRLWTPFYLAAESSLTIRNGLLNLGHDYLRQAVRDKWLTDDGAVRDARLHLVRYFAAIPDATDRCIDELPTLLHDLERWEELKDFLGDLRVCFRMRNKTRWRWELHRFWIPLGRLYSSAEVYANALEVWEESGEEPGRLGDIAQALARLHQDAGDAHAAETLCRRALALLERTRGVEHPTTLNSANTLATLLQDAGDHVGAESLYRRNLDVQQRTLGEDHSDTLLSMSNLAVLLHGRGDCQGARSLLWQALALSERALGPDDPRTLATAGNLGDVLKTADDYSDAERFLRRTLEGRRRVLGPEHPDTLSSVSSLADLLETEGEYGEAERLFRRVLEGRRRVLGPEHPDTLSGVQALARLLKAKGEYDEAEQLVRRALEERERLLGADHPATLASVVALADVMEDQGDYASAEMWLRRSLEGRRRVLGGAHSDTLVVMSRLAGVLGRRGNYAKAISAYREVLAIATDVLGPEHPETLGVVHGLGAVLREAGDLQEAEQLLRRVLDARERRLGGEHPNTLMSLCELAWVLMGKRDYVGAEPLLQRVLEVRRARLGDEHPGTLAIMSSLATVLWHLGRSDEAESLARRALDGRRRVRGLDHPETLVSLNNLGSILHEKGDLAAAERLVRQALEGRQRTLGAEHLDTLISMNNLASLLKDMGRASDAEPLLRQAITGVLELSAATGRSHPSLKGFVGNYASLLKGAGHEGQAIEDRVNELLGPFGLKYRR